MPNRPPVKMNGPHSCRWGGSPGLPMHTHGKFRRAAPWLAAISLFFTASIAPAYYHFVHYRSQDGRLQAVIEKFDLPALVDDTVYFFVSDRSPRLADNDSFVGLVSQVRQALSAWSSVPASALRVAYGGLSETPLPSRTAAGEIIFEELPPGVIGLGGPVTRGESREYFVPIVVNTFSFPTILSDSSAGVAAGTCEGPPRAPLSPRGDSGATRFSRTSKRPNSSPANHTR